MADLLRGLGADPKYQSLPLMHRAPNDELQPERITLISTAVRMQLD